MMKDFFHGWRRKGGVVTLVMASILMAVWIRSGVVIDAVKFSPPPYDSIHYLTSAGGSVQWMRREFAGGRIATFWYTERLASRPDMNLNVDDNIGIAWTISYRSIVIPLTLLSAYLILWKPRIRAQKQSSTS